MTFYLKIVVPPHMLILTFTQYAPQYLAVPPISDRYCFIPLIIVENYCSICIQHFFWALALRFSGEMNLCNSEFDREIKIFWSTNNYSTKEWNSRLKYYLLTIKRRASHDPRSIPKAYLTLFDRPYPRMSNYDQ